MPTIPTSTRRKATRRDELLDAAVRRFAASGVQGTSVDDIVREAGAAKGTFYLYFPSREAIVAAVAERLVERIVVEMERALGDATRSPADRIRGLSAAMGIVTADSYEAELTAELHRPENAPIHDRLGATVIERLLPAVEAVVASGVEHGAFVRQEPRRAAAFVLGAYSAVDHLVTEPGELGPVTRDLDAFVLRGLGHEAAAR